MFKKEDYLQEAMELYAKYNSSEKVADALCNKYGITKSGSIARTIRKWKQEQNEENKEVVEEPLSEVYIEATKRQSEKNKSVYIITSAQNATPIHKELWENIKAYASYIQDCVIEVIPLRYKNPTSLFQDLEHEFWAEEIQPYLIANRHNILENVAVLGDVKMQPTASVPLSGLEGLTGKETSIVGHPRQHFKTLPILENQIHKFLISTGSITIENYTDSKAGKKGEFHHSIGFVIVENLGEGMFTFRHVSADNNGSFYDLDFFVSGGVVEKVKGNVTAIVLGDLHLGDTCPLSLEASYEMLQRFSPNYTICHDIMDGASVNPHEQNDPFILAKKEQNNELNIGNEIKKVINFLHTIVDFNPIIVKSNHDIFVDRYLLNDWRKTHSKNDYLKYAYLKTNGELENGILPYEVNKEFGDRVVCLTENDSFKVCGVELGIHGHLGVSGSRANITQFKRLNTKVVLAHSHQPQKQDGCTYVGTLTKLRIGYNKGLSPWANSNVIVHENGKVQNLLIFNGMYTKLK